MIETKTFAWRGEMPQYLQRPLSDIASLFGYSQSDAATIMVKIVVNECNVAAEFEHGNILYRAETACSCNLRGEVIRAAKLALAKVFLSAESEAKQLPFGILTGVRPVKLMHKLLAEGIRAEDLPEYLEEKYLLPSVNGKLLRNICLLQKNKLSDKERFCEAGIYINIPYCPSRCSYCSFPSGIMPEDEISQQNFLNLIEHDVKSVVQLLGMHGLRATSLYVGGGTPLSFSERAFLRLLRILHDSFSSLAVKEYTVEAGRPDCFSLDKLRAMEYFGVDRISVNPQTFHDKTLRLVGRNHSVKDFFRAYEMVKAGSIKSVNMDLIIGLPGETADDIKFSLAKAFSMDPDNVTVHALTLKRKSSLRSSKREDLIPSAAAEETMRYGAEQAANSGMHPYYLYRQHYMLGNLANIGYSKLGKECIYNIQMMEERHPIIGAGPASASKRPLVDGYHLQKFYMPKNVGVYADKLTNLCEERNSLYHRFFDSDFREGI